MDEIETPRVPCPCKACEKTTTDSIHHSEQLFEVVLETETLNGIPVDTMATLIKFESLVATLFSATRVHHRTQSQFGSLPLQTIFQPVVAGHLCKGICHMEDVANVIRVMANCLSRCSFIDAQCLRYLHSEMLHSVGAATNWGLNDSNDDIKNMVLQYNKTALYRVTKFLRLLNEQTYDYRGFVRKPLPRHAPFSLFDITPLGPQVDMHNFEEKRGFWIFRFFGCSRNQTLDNNPSILC
jgi:hypothetical protein